jgi:P27 family predicted phage terminase small subunit
MAKRRLRRASQPTAIRLLRGSPGHHKYNEHEPTPEPCLPDVPVALLAEQDAACDAKCGSCARCRAGWTAREAVIEWNRRAPALFRMRVLTDWDTSAFEGYCRAWARYQNAETKVAIQGEVVMTPGGYPIQNPYRSIANKALLHCQQFWSEFGMTPSARTRIGVKPDGASAPTNPLHRFLRYARRD